MRLRDLVVAGTGHRRWTVLAALAALAAAAFGLLLLGLSGWLITGTALAGLGMIGALEIFAPGAGIRAAAVGRTVARYLERLIGHEAMFRQLADIRTAAFERVLALPVARLESLRRGDTLNRLTRDIDTLDHLLPGLVLPSLGALGVTLLAVVWLAASKPVLGMIVAGVFITVVGAVLVPGTLAVGPPGRRLAAATPRMRERLAEWLSGLAELVSLDRAVDRAGPIMAQAIVQIRARLVQQRIQALMHGGIMVLGYAGFWLVLLIGLRSHEQDGLDASLLGALALVVLALVENWLPLAASWSFQPTLRAAARRVEKPVAPAPAPATPVPCPAPARLMLEAGAVSFTFGVSGARLLDEVNLRLAPGERVAISGASGAGKSTLARLLAGVLTPDAGRVTLGGIPLQHLDERVVRAAIGLLTQQAVVFNDTLRANLLLAAPGADESHLARVLEMLELETLVASMPRGLDSWLGEQGRAVSGGEARRIALARIVLGDFPIAILDEPTAGLDAATAGRIAENLEPWLTGRSLVMMSHDPGTLPPADRFLYLRRGVLEGC